MNMKIRMHSYNSSFFTFRHSLFLLLALALSINATAQEKTWLVGVGHNSLLDTYLSQEHYSGVEFNLMHDLTKRLKKDSLWSRSHTYSLSFALTKPRSDAATDYFAMFDYSFGMHRCLLSDGKFDIAVGAQVDFYVGGIYNSRNGNNPGQLKLGGDLAPSVKASYRFSLFHKPMRVDYNAHMPLVGLEFSPAYGQSYYEIFTKDNYDHNVCFTSPFGAVNFFQRLTVNVYFSKTALTFGYLGNYRQSEHNSLKYHAYTHSFLIGFTL